MGVGSLKNRLKKRQSGFVIVLVLTILGVGTLMMVSFLNSSSNAVSKSQLSLVESQLEETAYSTFDEVILSFKEEVRTAVIGYTGSELELLRASACTGDIVCPRNPLTLAEADSRNVSILLSCSHQGKGTFRQVGQCTNSPSSVDFPKVFELQVDARDPDVDSRVSIRGKVIIQPVSFSDFAQMLYDASTFTFASGVYSGNVMINFDPSGSSQVYFKPESSSSTVFQNAFIISDQARMQFPSGYGSVNFIGGVAQGAPDASATADELEDALSTSHSDPEVSLVDINSGVSVDDPPLQASDPSSPILELKSYDTIDATQKFYLGTNGLEDENCSTKLRVESTKVRELEVVIESSGINTGDGSLVNPLPDGYDLAGNTPSVGFLCGASIPGYRATCYGDSCAFVEIDPSGTGSWSNPDGGVVCRISKTDTATTYDATEISAKTLIKPQGRQIEIHQHPDDLTSSGESAAHYCNLELTSYASNGTYKAMTSIKSLTKDSTEDAVGLGLAGRRQNNWGWSDEEYKGVIRVLGDTLALDGTTIQSRIDDKATYHADTTKALQFDANLAYVNTGVPYSRGTTVYFSEEIMDIDSASQGSFGGFELNGTQISPSAFSSRMIDASTGATIAGANNLVSKSYFPSSPGYSGTTVANMTVAVTDVTKRVFEPEGIALTGFTYNYSPTIATTGGGGGDGRVISFGSVGGSGDSMGSSGGMQGSSGRVQGGL